MAKWARVGKDGTVVNVDEWDGDVNTWTPPADFTMVPADDFAECGGVWSEKDGFVRPVIVDKPQEKSDVDKLRDVLIAKGVLSLDDVSVESISK